MDSAKHGGFSWAQVIHLTGSEKTVTSDNISEDLALISVNLAGRRSVAHGKVSHSKGSHTNATDSLVGEITVGEVSGIEADA